MSSSSHFGNLAARAGSNGRPATSHGTTRRNNNNNNNNNDGHNQRRHNVHAAQQQRDMAHNAAEQRLRQQEETHHRALSSFSDDRGNDFLSNNNRSPATDTLATLGRPTNDGRPRHVHLEAGLSAGLNEVNSLDLTSNSRNNNNHRNNRNNNNNRDCNNHRNGGNRHTCNEQRGRGGGRGRGGNMSRYASDAKGVEPLTMAKEQQEHKYVNGGGRTPSYIQKLNGNRLPSQHQPQQQQPKNSNFATAATLQERQRQQSPTNNTMENVNDTIPKKMKTTARQQQQQPQQDQIDLTESDDGPSPHAAAAATAATNANTNLFGTRNNNNKRKTTNASSNNASSSSGQEAKDLVESMENDEGPAVAAFQGDYYCNRDHHQQRRDKNNKSETVPIPSFGGGVTDRTRKRQRQQQQQDQEQDVFNVDDSHNQDDDADDNVHDASPNNNTSTSSSNSNTSHASFTGACLQGLAAVANVVKNTFRIKKVNNNKNHHPASSGSGSGGRTTAGSKKRKVPGTAIFPGTSICNNNNRQDDGIAADDDEGRAATYNKPTRNGCGDKWTTALETTTVVPRKPRATFSRKGNNNSKFGHLAAPVLATRQTRATATTAIQQDVTAPSFKQQQQRQQPRRKGKHGSKSSSSSPEIVEIDDDSDDDGNDNSEQQQVDPTKMRSKMAHSSENVYEAVRIAIDRKMLTSDCKVALKDDGTIHLSCQEAPESTRATRNTRSKKSDDTRSSCRFDLNLPDAVQELKYFLVDDTDGSVIDVETEDVLEQEHLSFLFLKLNKTCKVGNNPPSSKPAGTQSVLIEFRSDSDIKELLKMVALVGDMAAFTDDGAKLNVAQAKIYGQVLLEHSQQEAKQRCSMSGKTDNNSSKFLHGKGENDTLLVYPIAGGDDVEINAAAKGLKELGALIAGGGDDDVVPGVVVAAAAAAASSATSSETSSSDDGATTDAIATAAGAPAAVAPAPKTGRTHNVTIQVGDYMRLEPEEYLNDSLIDFWMRWITRNGDNSTMHIFSTHFYTSLVDKGVDGVTNWTAKKNINIFEKKLLFIPINKSLHWSMVVVVNPSHIVTMEHPKDANEDDPASFILFMDSLKAHQIVVIATLIRTWLNSEWKRLRKNIESQKDDPFNTETLTVYNPKIPYQLNGWDCGVFMCRYAYGLYLLRDKTFSFRETNLRSKQPKDRFRSLITDSEEFDFTGDDIQRIRTEMKTLIEKLSVIYSRVKAEEKHAKQAKKATAKLALQVTQPDSAAICNDYATSTTTATMTTTPVGNLQSSQDSSDSTGVLEVGTVQKDTATLDKTTLEESQRRPQLTLQPDLDTPDEVSGAHLDAMMAAASLDDDRKSPPLKNFNVKQQHQRDSMGPSSRFETLQPTSFATATPVSRNDDAMAQGIIIDGATAIINNVDSRRSELQSNESTSESTVRDENDMECDENVGERNTSHESLVSEVEFIPGKKRRHVPDERRESCDL